MICLTYFKKSNFRWMNSEEVQSFPLPGTDITYCLTQHVVFLLDYLLTLSGK